MILTVADVLKEKGSEVVTVSEKASSYNALQLMQERKINALIVIDGSHKVVGIVSEGDYTRKIILQERSPKTTSVSEIMTRNIFGATPDRTVNECIAMMLKEKIRHLPVFNQEKLAGIISIGDTVKSIVKGQAIEIKHLSNYIAGKYA